MLVDSAQKKAHHRTDLGSGKGHGLGDTMIIGGAIMAMDMAVAMAEICPRDVKLEHGCGRG